MDEKNSSALQQTNRVGWNMDNDTMTKDVFLIENGDFQVSYNSLPGYVHEYDQLKVELPLDDSNYSK